MLVCYWGSVGRAVATAAVLTQHPGGGQRREKRERAIEKHGNFECMCGKGTQGQQLNKLAP